MQILFVLFANMCATAFNYLLFFFFCCCCFWCTRCMNIFYSSMFDQDFRRKFFVFFLYQTIFFSLCANVDCVFIIFLINYTQFLYFSLVFSFFFFFFFTGCVLLLFCFVYQPRTNNQSIRVHWSHHREKWKLSIHMYVY